MLGFLKIFSSVLGLRSQDWFETIYPFVHWPKLMYLWIIFLYFRRHLLKSSIFYRPLFLIKKQHNLFVRYLHLFSYPGWVTRFLWASWASIWRKIKHQKLSTSPNLLSLWYAIFSIPVLNAMDILNKSVQFKI